MPMTQKEKRKNVDIAIIRISIEYRPKYFIPYFLGLFFARTMLVSIF